MKYKVLVLILALGLLLCACDSAGNTNGTTTPSNGLSPTSPQATDGKDDVTLPEDLQEGDLPLDFFDDEDQVISSRPLKTFPADPTEPPATKPAATEPISATPSPTENKGPMEDITDSPDELPYDWFE